MNGYKVLTSQLMSPVQGTAIPWDGITLPFTLPQVKLDTSANECGAGWNFCRDAEQALRIGGFWPDGWRSIVVSVEAKDALVRGDKCRAATLTITGIVAESAIEEAVRGLSAKWFGEDVDRMAAQQLAWRRALGRPGRDAAAVVVGLKQALDARGLSWKSREYPSARDAWAAWDARDTRDAWAAWDARDAWDTRDAWAARVSWDAWAARDARVSLIQYYAGLRGWVKSPEDRLTVGIRDAYEHGLALAVPIAKAVLGWVMSRAESSGPIWQGVNDHGRRRSRTATGNP